MAWMMYIGGTGKNISFINEGIQYQMPVLVIVILLKYGILVCRRFKTSKKLFYTNLVGYMCFLVIVVILDYRIEFGL